MACPSHNLVEVVMVMVVDEARYVLQGRFLTFVDIHKGILAVDEIGAIVSTFGKI